MTRNTGKSIALFVLTTVATWGLLLIGILLDDIVPATWSSIHPLDRQLRYQLVTFVLAGGVALVLRRLKPDAWRTYAHFGNIAAPALKNPIFGIKGGESWRTIGWTFSAIITAVTAAVIWLPKHELRASFYPMLWVPALAAANAAVEETLTRLNVVVALDGMMRPAPIAIVSGLVFGTVHYFGTPGGTVGMILAGVMGWLLARSVLETRGVFWAWWIQFLQDVVIIGALVLAD